MNTTKENELEIIQKISETIKSLKYGSIEITVHEGKVTQIERREKLRFEHRKAVLKSE